ncbi:hypothetical protein EVAR_59760_1 [Eumeta japonica]|uniref:Uncharacterized protein n=1 Tax=Eumeta variegata TaxID=151549 RepID=A0A4C1ZR47_EUMVA|nr:hypothetical protein EVAR_59760_1 [Eumeta japonica]
MVYHENREGKPMPSSGHPMIKTNERVDPPSSCQRLTAYRQTNNYVGTLAIKTLAGPPYSVDLAPFDFYIFPEIQKQTFKKAVYGRLEAAAAYEKAVDATFAPHFLSVVPSNASMY